MDRARVRLLERLRFSLTLLAALATLIQFALDGTPQNVFSVLFAMSGIVVVNIAHLRPHLYDRYPLSAFSVFFYGFTTLWLPLVVSTFLYWRPITHNLQEPVAVFGYSFGVTMALVAAHAFYQRWPNLNRVRFGFVRAADRLGLHAPRTNLQLWVVGLCGLLTVIYTLRSGSSVTGSPSSAFEKFLMPFHALTFAPLAIALRPFERSNQSVISPWQILSLVLYAILILVLSVVGNSRETFAFPIASLTIAFALGIFAGHLQVSRRVSRWAVFLAVAGLFLAPMFAQVSAAMLLARQYRGVVSAGELSKLTVENFLRISQGGSQGAQSGSGYDDFYYSDPFLSRLSNPKFLDNSIAITGKIGDAGREKLAGLELQRLGAILPAPVLKFFGIPIDKQLVGSFSVGDYEWYLYTGSGLGTFLTTSFVGDGAAIFGIWFLPVTMLIAWLWFPVLDCLTRVARVSTIDVSDPDLPLRTRYEARFSTLFAPTAFLFASFFVQCLSMSEFILSFRDILQLFLAYALIFWLTGSLSVRSRVRVAQVYA